MNLKTDGGMDGITSRQTILLRRGGDATLFRLLELYRKVCKGIGQQPDQKSQ